MSLPSVSIVIPLHILGEVFLRDLRTYADLDYPGTVQLVVVTDSPVDLGDVVADVVVTGQALTGPGEKRDAAMSVVTGDLVAFIDDDARPDSQWLLRAVRHFDCEDIAAVGGPGVTPPEDGFWARAGGAVYESFLGSGPIRYRFYPGAPRTVDDYPAYNFVVRRTALEKVGGWDSAFYGGEDTKLCLALVEAGHRIVYDPEAVVYHHRRALFVGHCRQIWNVGVHRGYFVKAFPETSRRFSYFAPMAVVFGGLGAVAIALASGQLSVPAFGVLVLIAWAAAAAQTLLTTQRSFLVAAAAGLGVYATHITYAVGFVRGLTLQELKR